MAAALLPDLVFHVHRGHADALEILDGATDVERPAPAGIDIDQQRHAGGIHDPARIGEHVFHRADAEIGHAQRIRGDPATGEVQRLVTHALGHQAGVGGDRAHHLQRGFGGQCCTEACACGLGHGGDFWLESAILTRQPELPAPDESPVRIRSRNRVMASSSSSPSTPRLACGMCAAGS